MREIMAMTVKTSVIWISCNYFYTYAMINSSMTSLFVISNSTPAWSYLLCLSPLVPVALRERFSLTQGCMVWLLIVGFSIISVEDSKSGKSDEANATIYGNAACLLSAISFAVYGLFLKIMIP